jgi:hypothetical protein
VEKRYLRMRQTESTEYKYFEIKRYKGSVIIELYNDLLVAAHIKKRTYATEEDRQIDSNF